MERTVFYSSSKRGFYSPEIDKIIPADAMEVSKEYYDVLFAGQAQGKLIIPGSDGTPVLQDPPKPTAEQFLAAAEANRRAAYIAEADPLFFKTQRGEVEQQVWLDKVTEIKTRYPKEAA
jgi:hypothetical protein